MREENGIELRDLRHFVSLANELPFNRAVTRPPFGHPLQCQAVDDIERVLGVRLFETNPLGMRLTRAGATFLDHGRQVIAQMEQAVVRARSAALGHSNQVRIGVSDCMAYCRLTEVLTRYRARNTEDLVSLHEMPLQRQISHLRDDLLDASISLDGSPREGIFATAIASDELCAVIPSVHPLAHTEALSVTDLAHYPLILFNDNTDLRAGQLIEEFVAKFGRPHVAYRAGSLGTMLTLVALGHGIGLLGSSQLTCVARRDVVLRRIIGATPPLTTYMLHAGFGLPERLAKFIELARAVLSVGSMAERS